MPHSKVVHIQAAMPGTHTGGYAWYILARSMTLAKLRREHARLQERLRQASNSQYEIAFDAADC